MGKVTILTPSNLKMMLPFKSYFCVNKTHEKNSMRDVRTRKEITEEDMASHYPSPGGKMKSFSAGELLKASVVWAGLCVY